MKEWKRTWNLRLWVIQRLLSGSIPDRIYCRRLGGGREGGGLNKFFVFLSKCSMGTIMRISEARRVEGPRMGHEG